MTKRLPPFHKSCTMSVPPSRTSTNSHSGLNNFRSLCLNSNVSDCLHNMAFGIAMLACNVADWLFAQLQFRKIEEIESLSATTQLDVLGVVEAVEPAANITLRDGREAQKRSLTLRDDSNKSIELTLWGQASTNPGDQLEAVSTILKLPSSFNPQSGLQILSMAEEQGSVKTQMSIIQGTRVSLVMVQWHQHAFPTLHIMGHDVSVTVFAVSCCLVCVCVCCCSHSST